jgi:hypothetical protein
MSFEALVIRFSDRLLSSRTFDLIVAPALADLQFDDRGGTVRKAFNRAAVLRAVGGGLAGEMRREVGTFLALMLVPALYYVFLLTLCLDFFSATAASLAVISGLVFLSLGPVIVLFWPERTHARSVD